MEGIAFDLALTIDHLRSAGAPPRVIRAAGGGSRSNWWMQLKADLTGVPFEVVDHPEAGALGAAIAAGLADGTYPALNRRSTPLVRPGPRVRTGCRPARPLRRAARRYRTDGRGADRAHPVWRHLWTASPLPFRLRA